MTTDPLSSTEPLFALRVPARPDRLRLVRAAVGEAAMLCGVGSSWVGDLVLAVDEACQNVIRHAYCGRADGDMVIEMRREADRLEVRLVDFAPRVDPSLVKPRNLTDLRPGGLGTYFIRILMDDVEFCEPPEGAGNCLRMTKRIE
ncbi:MAG: ATP-binding protein [Alphaproteobacteria bacterium]